MIETNTKTGESKVFCDRCFKELATDVVVMNSGDCLCKECLNKEYRIMSVEEYLNENT